jgi:hypothetical protein
MTVLALAACSTMGTVGSSVNSAASSVNSAVNHPAPIGRLMDRPPPGVTVTSGEPSGPLLTGAGLAELPDQSVDLVVAKSLKEWLTFEERKNLAEASEYAATGLTGAAVAWTSRDGAHALTANGSATAVDDVYLSLRGHVCRDVRQNVTKRGDSHFDTVTLCRSELQAGVPLWIVDAVE